MKLRDARIPASFGRLHDSSDFGTFPAVDEAVIAELKRLYPAADLVMVEGYSTDIARIEHTYWTVSNDWHVKSYRYVVDDDTGIVYSVIEVE